MSSVGGATRSEETMPLTQQPGIDLSTEQTSLRPEISQEKSCCGVFYDASCQVVNTVCCKPLYCVVLSVFQCLVECNRQCEEDARYKAANPLPSYADKRPLG
jgi:hypothetical protein